MPLTVTALTIGGLIIDIGPIGAHTPTASTVTVHIIGGLIIMATGHTGARTLMDSMAIAHIIGAIAHIGDLTTVIVHIGDIATMAFTAILIGEVTFAANAGPGRFDAEQSRCKSLRHCRA
jgi:hypothetical protein